MAAIQKCERVGQRREWYRISFGKLFSKSAIPINKKEHDIMHLRNINAEEGGLIELNVVWLSKFRRN
jgi:hypothetical protein